MVTQKGEIFRAFIGICFFVLSITIIFFRIFLLQQKKYRLLQQEKLHAEMKASQMERDEIASELHNDILPNLATIHYWLYQIELTDNRLLMQSINLINETIDKSRGIIKNASPVSLYGLSFQTAIIQYIQSIKEKNDLAIYFTELDEITCSTDQNNHIFRILQEIILNTVKHSKAKKLEIEISKSNDHLLIRTADDGVGFDITSKNSSGFGLLIIESKVDYLKGVLKKNEEKNKGTQFNIRIPLDSFC